MVPLFSPRTGPSRLRTAKLRGGSSSAISTVMSSSRRPMRRVTTARVPTATGPSPILSARTTPPCHSGRCEGSVTYANTSSGLREISMLATMGAIACLLPGDEPSMIPHLGTARYERPRRRPPASRKGIARSRDTCGMGARPLPAKTKGPASAPLLHPLPRRPPVILAGRLPCGDQRLRRALCGDSGAGSARDETSLRPSAPSQSTKHTDLQVFYGSDGTRTRDLRRDRPVRRNRLQPATTQDQRLEQGFPHGANRL